MTYDNELLIPFTFYQAIEPIEEYCFSLQKSELADLIQALKIVNVTSQNRYQTCTRFDSLYRVMELLSDAGVRRVIVIEANSRQVEGIITLRDVFAYILA